MEDQHAEVMELSLEQTIDTKLVQSNVTQQVIGALKQKYSGMTLKALNDKESYLEIKAAAKDCAKLRTLTVKICKEGRERAVKEQKLWIAKEKEVVGQIAEVEDALDAEAAKFDAEVERLVNEEKERQESAYINRQATLTKMGAVYADGSFVLGAASFEAALVKESSQDVWEESIVPKFQAEYEKIEAVRIEEERKKKEADDLIKAEQEKLRQEQEVFRLQQEEFRKQQEETARKEKEKQDAADKLERERTSELQKQRFQLLFPFNPTGADVDMNTLWSLDESRFKEVLEGKKNEFEKKQLELERVAEEKRLAAIELAEKEAVRKEQERVAAEEERKKAEMDAASDKVKWVTFIDNLKELDTYEMRSGQYRSKMNAAKQKINEILAL